LGDASAPDTGPVIGSMSVSPAQAGYRSLRQECRHWVPSRLRPAQVAQAQVAQAQVTMQNLAGTTGTVLADIEAM
jgi:hypothetical protein